MTVTYEEFLTAKVDFDTACGFDVDPAEVNPILLPHQRDVVVWAVQGGRRALFEAFGLGKSVQQLEVLRLTLAKSGGARSLIVCPLGVRQEFKRDAAMLGLDVTFVRRDNEVTGPGLYLTNYESVRDGRLDPAQFDAVSLDEASVLRSFGSKTYQTFLTLFDDVPYRFVATATPSPNRYKELIHYAGFLGVMDTGAALTRWFQRDSTKANNLTLYPHKAREFFLWLSTWAIFLQRPSDLGYSDDGYDLPPLDVRWHEIESGSDGLDFERDGQVTLASTALGITQAARHKRDSMPARVATAAEIVEAAPDDHFILWHDLEDERRALKDALPEAVEVYGSLDLDERERRIVDFSEGRSRLLLTKPILSGSGCNFQRHCHRAIYVGVGFKFNDFYQSLHRIQRFLQREPVRIDIIHTEAEREVVQELRAKWAQHEELMATMAEIIREYGLARTDVAEALTRAMGVERIEAAGDGWLVANNDCVDETKAMAENSVDLIVTSIPFSNHYEYTPNYCYDEEAQVLTQRGWIGFADLTTDDEVATLQPDSLAFEWQRPTATIWERYAGPMMHFRNRNNFDLLVTPDHNLFVDRRVGNRVTGRKERRYGKVRAEEVARGFVPRKYRMINAARGGDGAWPEQIAVPQLPRAAKGPAPRAVEELEPAAFMELAGWYLSEGYCDPVDGPHGGRITIAQTAANPGFRAEIALLFERIGLTAQIQERAIVAHSKSLAAFLLHTFGSGSYHKKIPRWIKDLHPDLLTILRDTMMKGDGSKTGYAYTSVSADLRDDFQEIALRTGWGATVRGDVVHISQRQTFPEIRTAPEVVAYDGMIGCATVPNGTLVVRRNGVASVSGNCDFGHTDDNAHFWAQMDYLTPELLRVLAPGRIYACHVKDRILFGNVTGAGVPTVSPFHAEALFHGLKHGFDYLGMITVVTDVVRENNQTYRLGYTEMRKDGSKMGVGSPEYILLFHKPQTDRTKGYADERITKTAEDYSLARWQVDAHAFWRSSGDRHLTPDELASLPHDQMSRLFTEQTLREVYDYESHVRIGEQLQGRGALPSTFMALAPGSHHPDVWHDVNRMLTLNGEQRRRNVQMHVCPLQIQIVDRLINRYSNEGDLVYDPFAGLGTVPLRAVKMGRRGRGAELNSSYWLDSVKYLEAAERQRDLPTFFDLVDIEGEAAS